MFRRCQLVFVALGLICTAGEQKTWGGVAYTITDLGALGPAGSSSAGYAVNAAGQVAGWTNASADSGVRQAFLYSGGTMTDLGTLGGSNSYGYGINDSGQVVGNSTTSAARDSRLPLQQRDDGRPGNARRREQLRRGRQRQRAGCGLRLPQQRRRCPFLYSGGTMINLGTFGDNEGGTAWDVNSSGQVVGYVYNSANYLHAFLYSGGTMTDLGTLGGSMYRDQRGTRHQ